VPAGNLLGSTVTVTELVENGATAPPLDADSQLPPELGVALTVKFSAALPVLAITMDCVKTDVDPCVAAKLRARGLTSTAGPEFPITLRDNVKGIEKGVVMPSMVKLIERVTEKV
jgi:hypothetical protein